MNDILVKENSFDPIFKIFLQNYEKNNLISSCISDIFNFISNYKIDKLSHYIFEGFSYIIYDERYTFYFTDLKKMNENRKKPSIFSGNNNMSEINYIDKFDNNMSELNGNIMYSISKNSQLLNRKHYLIFEEDALSKTNSKK